MTQELMAFAGDQLPSLPEEYEEKLQQQLAAIQQQVAAPSTKVIKINRAGTAFDVTGLGLTQSDTLNVVIVGWMNLKLYYSSPYDPRSKKISPPDCFSMDPRKHDLHSPDESVPEPCASICSECPKNQWDPIKECKDRVVVAVLLHSDDSDFAAKDLYLIKVYPTGLKYWNKYVNSLKTRYNAVPQQVITTLKPAPAGNSDAFTFDYTVAGINTQVVNTLDREDEAKEIVTRKPDMPEKK